MSDRQEDAPDPGARDANSPPQITTENSLAAVLDRIVVFVSWFLWTQSDHQLNAIALWVVHTFLIDEFDVTRYLEISAPEKRCGKTRLLELLDQIVAKRSLRNSENAEWGEAGEFVIALELSP